ncbi:hypothetical protein ACQEU5_01390 [Marinactinospora thermotolerans]|uniref:Uncharacterized protein n=1 Tax=Marinactinospora thermotolerans DSM 45154 TaxID=1122192 RepID=A0A1T4MC52_9ACTN|nr:hypothetical protein [Marinactinospora thermotolerans]SJZ64620.1 hypothetical protein SAMN02745673_01048 [Marinactinospora thermotolerans DSM 45154]
MTWSWRYETAEGALLADEALPQETFSSRGDAESWLGETWRDLADAGAERVALLEDDREVYRMELAE